MDVTCRLTSCLRVLLRRRLYCNSLMAVAISLLDDAYPAACLHSRRDVHCSVFVVQVEGLGRDDLTWHGDLDAALDELPLRIAVGLQFGPARRGEGISRATRQRDARRRSGGYSDADREGLLVGQLRRP